MHRTIFLFILGVGVGVDVGTAQDYIIEQQANGSPGVGSSQGGEMVAQRVWISSGKLKIADVAGSLTQTIVRLDQEKLYLIYPEVGVYKERALSELNGRLERDTKREELRQRILAMPLGEGEQDKLLEENGLRRDGKTVSTVSYLSRRKTVAGFSARGVKILENGVSIATLWLVDILPRPPALFDAYRAISTFSEPVEQRLAELHGFPVEMEIRFDSGDLMAFTLKAQVSAIRSGKVAAGEFEVPEGLQKLDWDQPLPRKERLCDVCGKPVPDSVRRPYEGTDGQPIWICSPACRMRYIQGVREDE